jgi:hypothetical protein
MRDIVIYAAIFALTAFMIFMAWLEIAWKYQIAVHGCAS